MLASIGVEVLATIDVDSLCGVDIGMAVVEKAAMYSLGVGHLCFLWVGGLCFGLGGLSLESLGCPLLSSICHPHSQEHQGQLPLIPLSRQLPEQGPA